jgi:hypothetical protein
MEGHHGTIKICVWTLLLPIFLLINDTNMRSIRNLSIVFMFFAVALLASCGGGSGSSESSSTETMEAADKSGPEYTSAYVCPMHCKGSGSDKPGNCPVCKMEYVVNEDHDHDHGHEGHNH